jgi:hypothetical protein
MNRATAVADPEAFLSVGKLALEANVTRQRIQKMVQKGTIQSVHIGHYRLIPRDEAERVIASISRVARPDGRTLVVFNLKTAKKPK